MNKIVANAETGISEEVPLTPEEEAAWNAGKAASAGIGAAREAAEKLITDRAAIVAIFQSMTVIQQAKLFSLRIEVDKAMELGNRQLAAAIVNSKNFTNTLEDEKLAILSIILDN